MTQLIQDVLTGLLRHLHLTFTAIAVDDSDELMIRVDIASNEASRLIGWHGETINAIQHLLKAIVHTQGKLPKSPFIVLDVDGYRRAQEDRVRRIAQQKADFVRRKKTRIALPPMSPYFRRVVHLEVANNPDLQDFATESIGEGEYRQVVLRLKEEEPDDGPARTTTGSDGELVPVVDGDEDAGDGQGFENLDV